MIKIKYKLLSDRPYIVGYEDTGADTLSIEIMGIEDGFIHIGNTVTRLKAGAAELAVRGIEYGINRCELIYEGGLIPLFPIERGYGAPRPVVDTYELCALERDLLSLNERLLQIELTLKDISDVTLKTTIL